MKIVSCGKTDIGLLRKNNEDSYFLMPERPFFAVADGMGGSEGGEIASSIFVEAARQVCGDGIADSVDGVSAMIRETFRLSNERILAHAEQYPLYRGMGCTAEVIAFVDNLYVVGHVGDSRTYLYRDGELRQITRDHSLVQTQLEQGRITQEEAKRHRLRNIVLRAVGIHPMIELDIIRGRIQPDDVFLVCSDGLTDMIDDSLIRDTLSSSAELDDKADRLIEHAKSAGGNDNITIILCRIVPE